METSDNKIPLSALKIAFIWKARYILLFTNKPGHLEILFRDCFTLFFLIFEGPPREIISPPTENGSLKWKIRRKLDSLLCKPTSVADNKIQWHG